MAAVLLPSISLAVSLQVSQRLQRPHTAEHKRHRSLFSCSRHSRLCTELGQGIFGNLGSYLMGRRGYAQGWHSHIPEDERQRNELSSDVYLQGIQDRSTLLSRASPYQRQS